MHEVGERLFHEAMSVMNRALEGGAKANEMLPGAEEGAISLAVLGANPDEDQGVMLELKGRQLEIAGRFDPHGKERRVGLSIRLDDLKRIASDPEHFASAPEAIARLVSPA